LDFAQKRPSLFFHEEKSFVTLPPEDRLEGFLKDPRDALFSSEIKQMLLSKIFW